MVLLKKKQNDIIQIGHKFLIIHTGKTKANSLFNPVN